MKVFRSNRSIGSLSIVRSLASKLYRVLAGLILISGILVFVSFRSPEKDQSQGEYITMRIYENFTVTSSRIIIVYADDRSEIVELGPFKFNDDYIVKNNQVITRTLNKLRKEGYRIVVSSSGGKVTSNKDMMITTYILERQAI